MVDHDDPDNQSTVIQSFDIIIDTE